MPLTPEEQEELDLLERKIESVERFLGPRPEISPQVTPPTLPETAIQVAGVLKQLPGVISASKFDIGGGITGGIAGARLGAPLGPAGIVAGGVVGGIAGATAGKQLDVLAGTRGPQPLSQQIGISTLEELGGRAVAPFVAKVGNALGVGKLFSAIGERTGLSRAPKTIND